MGNQTDGQKVAEGTPGATATALGDFQMYIDGEWVDARAKGLLEIVDPATEEVVARVANGGAEDAEAAVAAARCAFDEGPWPRTPAAERAAVLHAAAVLVRERVDEMARWESLEMGKLFSDGQGDISRVADLLDYAGDLAERLPHSTTY
jgi:betaine-aldehyde dehydrogenase